ncbi:hypothetical protein C1T30_43270, partial [Bacillus sp. MBGLi97]
YWFKFVRYSTRKVKIVKNYRKILEVKKRALILKVWFKVGLNGLKPLTGLTGFKLGLSLTYK